MFDTVYNSYSMAPTTKQYSSKVNPDLAKERKKCSFNTLELTHLLDGGAQETERRRRQEQIFLTDPELMDGVPFDYLSHKGKYEEVIRKLYILKKKLATLQKEDRNFNISTTLKHSIFKDSTPLDAHYAMFVPAIITQGTDKQKEKWLKRSENCNIIGAYAQTELAHGTFIRGLETTATYQPETQEFILNSPTLSSYKWWPGSIGNTSNYALVLAQLYSLNKCHGIHMFVVQLRDEETHGPLPGIQIGDIGPKVGMSGANNGYLGFKNVRIARENMLMKYCKVLPDGTYTRSLDNKLTYGTMVGVRVSIVKMAAIYMKIAVTIAIRYSAVRRQCKLSPSGPELQVIDYITQQHKLFPILASVFAFHYSSLWIKNVYDQVNHDIREGNLHQLPELHALSSCLKVIASTDASASIETCRLACGGHGYLMCSGLPVLYGTTTAMCTYEGENTVLLLQTARSLMKAWSQLVEGKSSPLNVQYLKDANESKDIPFRKSIDWIVWALEKLSAGKIELVWKQLNAQISTSGKPEETWNLNTVDLCAAAEVYGRAFVVKIFRNMITDVTKTASQSLKRVLFQLVDLYGVYTILKLQGDLLRFTGTLSSTVEVLQQWQVQLLSDIRPNAVGVVDGFDLDDKILGSALGAYDGNVYERLFEEAAKSPLNTEPVDKTFHLYLKPFMKANL